MKRKRFDPWQLVIGWAAIVTGALGLAFLCLFLFPAPALSRTDLRVGQTTLHLEVVSTELAKQRGLGGRTSLAPDWGMLFLFPDSKIQPFWMKDMHFPIDIIWLNHGVVTDVVTLPAPANETENPAAFAPRHPADRVLELNAGMARSLGLKPGVRLALPK